MDDINTFTSLLIIPIWPLFNMATISDTVYDQNLSEYLKKGYNLEKRKRIHKALKWAKENSTYDFLTIAKMAPTNRKMKFNNQEIYIHLINFKKFMENEKYGLLTDDRSTNLFWERDE